jgi:hypothetical protein
MKRKSFLVILIILLSTSVFIANAQSSNDDRYSIVKLNGNIVSNILSEYPSFAYIDFTFQLVNDNIYSLSGIARDVNGTSLGTEFVLSNLETPAARPLKNLEKGHLYLTSNAMKKYYVDGSEDYILTPKKCKNKVGKLVDYVSYRFSNKITTTTSYLISAPKLIDFDLNPSPPY